jgi:hypothetical protein
MIDTDRETIHAKGLLIPILQISPIKYLQFSWSSKITDYVPLSGTKTNPRATQYIVAMQFTGKMVITYPSFYLIHWDWIVWNDDE